jgi:protein SCO1
LVAVTRTLAFLLALAALIGLTACDQRQAGTQATQNKFNSVDVTGADYGKDFALTGHDGKPRRLSDFRGKAVLFFFGFTNCPDYCPSALASFKQALALLGADAQRVQVVFFTLDPERDKPDVLKQYVTGFDPSFLGLYTDVAATQKTAQQFRIFFEKQGVDSATGSYNVDHTVGAYVFDPQGRLRLFIASGATPEKIAQDLRVLLS